MTAENETRNALIAQSVRLGLTYGEAAKIHGVTRGVVAGVCDRAGVKVGRLGKRRRGLSPEGARKSWQDPEIRRKRTLGIRRAMQDVAARKRFYEARWGGKA